jgi:hypothetical protein
MAKRFHELRERLLRAGVAPRHVRRYLRELGDHLADLRAEEERAGRQGEDAESAALARLGGVDELSTAMIERRQLQSWSARAPWAVFGLGPVLVLAATWSVALFFLWVGWRHFLAGADTPFGRRPGIHHLLESANVYFQLDRALFFGGPILVGWAMALAAARQRAKVVWPAVGLFLVALLGSTAQVHAVRIGATGGRQISLNFTFAHFAMSPVNTTPSIVPFGWFDVLAILSLTAAPYLIWRLHRAHESGDCIERTSISHR